MASGQYRKLKYEEDGVRGLESNEIRTIENTDEDEYSVSLALGPGPIIEEGVADVCDVGDDLAELGDEVDGKKDPDKKNFKYLKTYHEALICVLLQADSIYKQAVDYRLKRKMRELKRLADTQIIHLKSFQTWEKGTTHFRCDVTGMNGLHGFYVKKTIIDDWENMKRGRDSFKEKFYRDMVTDDTCQRDENKRLNSRNFTSHYGESAGNLNRKNTNFKEKLEMMSRDFEDAATALEDLNSHVENIHSCCWIFRYFQLKRCIDRYMLVVEKILRQRGYCI